MEHHGSEVGIGISPAPRIQAAQYVRMSTEHQQYSTANQEDTIREYAQQRGFEIVCTYADDGKSGLRMEGRNSLRKLLADVQAGTANFSAILVYDVSRWGRFQDADESAYYEYLCKRAGIDVHYCAEQFENDGGPASTIIKSVKRAMAGEYSRELSSKVFKGQCRLIELGYRQGGPAGYGLRRMLIDQTGQQKGILQKGGQKSIQTDRVILVPGPQEEVRMVQWIYQAFAMEGKREFEIAELLNAQGIRTDLGRTWTRGTVHEVLTNEKYLGHNVYNRSSFKLKKKHVQNSPEMWVRRENAFQAIVSPELFYTAQGIIAERNRRYSDDEMIQKLRMLIDRHTTISAYLIDTADDVPSSGAYRTRFGSLLQAYSLAGFCPARNYQYVEANRKLRELYPEYLEHLVYQLGTVGASVRLDEPTGLLLINNEYSAALVLSRCRQLPSGAFRWQLTLDRSMPPDITILVRMDTTNSNAVDYYLLPVMDLEAPKLLICEKNGIYLDTYQFESLDYFMTLSARKKIEVAA